MRPQLPTMLIALVLAACARPAIVPAPMVGAPSAPRPAAQNPSPMEEHTRAHERLRESELPGTTSTFTGPAARPVSLFVPLVARERNVVDLVVHFHGAAWLAARAVNDLADGTVAATVNLGAGSGAYHRAFADAATFDTLLVSIARAAHEATGRVPHFGRITLTGFSAGHGAIRAILLEPRHVARVHAVLLMDGMHTSYLPEGRVLADSGTLDTHNLVALAEFARAAARGEKRMLVTHSEIFPGTFASTTETADWLLRAIGVPRRATLAWGPRGMQQLSEARAGGFTLLGYAGNTAPDHIDQFHAMPELLAALLSPRSAPAR